MQLDLGSLKSVRSFAENFLRAEPRLDLLINNAGRSTAAYGSHTVRNFYISFFDFRTTSEVQILLDRLQWCVVNTADMTHEK